MIAGNANVRIGEHEVRGYNEAHGLPSHLRSGDMPLQFNSLTLDGFGPPSPDGTDMFSKVSMSLHDPEKDLWASIRVTTFVPRHPTITLHEIEVATRESVIAALRIAIETIEKHDLDTLASRDLIGPRYAGFNGEEN
jgi:hypothetical protein